MNDDLGDERNPVRANQVDEFLLSGADLSLFGGVAVQKLDIVKLAKSDLTRHIQDANFIRP